MIPTRRLVLLMLAPVLLALGALIDRTLLFATLVTDGVLVVVALLDALAGGARVTVERVHKPLLAVGQPSDVTLVLFNVGWRGVRLRVVDDAPGRVEGLPGERVLGGEEVAEVTYRLTVGRRGHYHFGRVALRWASPLGLWERQRQVLCEGEFRVYPDFRHLRRFGIKGRPDGRRSPVRSLRRPGGENEFQRLRTYVTGDPYRHIDWRATARKGHFITREFGQESNQNVIFLLDAGRMMSATCGEITAFDHALNAALAMGHAALRNGDRVGLVVYDHRIRVWLPPKGGIRSAQRLIRATYDVFPTLNEPDHDAAFRWLAQHVRQRSLVVCMTSVVDQVNVDLSNRLVKGLVGRHLPLCIWLRDPDVDRLLDDTPESEEDLYVMGAAAELSHWREVGLASLRRRGALVVDCTPDELTGCLLERYMEVKARRLL